jgi:hypothetical protein
MKALEHLSQNLQICSPILLVLVDRHLLVAPPSYMIQRTDKLSRIRFCKQLLMPRIQL